MDDIKSTGYYLIIFSKALRNKYNYRYIVFDRVQVKSLLQTNSRYELKIWMDLRGVNYTPLKRGELRVSSFHKHI